MWLMDDVMDFIRMSTLRDNFSTGMNFLRRRFSSDDLYSERQDEQDVQRLNLGKKMGLPSAPSFPSFSAVQGVTRGILSSQTGGTTPAPQKILFNRDRCKVLLIIDDRHTDWSKYFRGRKVLGDWDLRVEQAEFSEINVASYSDSGAVVDVQSTKNGANIQQSFKPDFVLVRQHARDASENWKHIVLGLHYGGVPSVNSLQSIYNFLDKPWVFSHLIQIRKRLGKDRFPLIDQSYYPNHREMASNLWLVIPKFPVVVKIGHAHSGMGKVKVDNHYGFQDIASVMAVTNCYSTTEPHIDAQCDIYIQKIGSIYKAYIRKAMSGNWKANIGSAILEQIPMTDRFKSWLDECASLFGGLDILSVKAIRGKDGREYIIEVNDSSMLLLDNSPDEDCRAIADLVLRRLEESCIANKTRESSASFSLSPSNRSLSSGGGCQVVNGLATDTPSTHGQGQGQNQGQGQGQSQGQAMAPGGRASHSPSMGRSSSIAGPSSTSSTNRQPPSNFSSATPNRSAPQSVQHVPAPRPSGPASPGTVEAIARELEESEPDDTMNNLRKTFAGIFGNI